MLGHVRRLPVLSTLCALGTVLSAVIASLGMPSTNCKLVYLITHLWVQLYDEFCVLGYLHAQLATIGWQR